LIGSWTSRESRAYQLPDLVVIQVKVLVVFHSNLYHLRYQPLSPLEMFGDAQLVCRQLCLTSPCCMASLSICILVVVERFIVGVDYKIVEYNACDDDAMSKRLVVAGAEA